MNSYNPQIYEESKPAKSQNQKQSGKAFYLILIGLAVAGSLILALSLLVPHKTGTVISVGRISSGTQSSGLRSRRHRYTVYRANLEVRSDDTAEMETVPFKSRNINDIPQAGDKIKYAHYLISGTAPYPHNRAAIFGASLLLVDLVYIIFAFIGMNRKRRSSCSAKRRCASDDQNPAKVDSIAGFLSMSLSR